jgi:hypothetical protein
VCVCVCSVRESEMPSTMPHCMYVRTQTQRVRERETTQTHIHGNSCKRPTSIADVFFIESAIYRKCYLCIYIHRNGCKRHGLTLHTHIYCTYLLHIFTTHSQTLTLHTHTHYTYLLHIFTTHSQKRLQAPWSYPTSIAALDFNPNGVCVRV